MLPGVATSRYLLRGTLSLPRLLSQRVPYARSLSFSPAAMAGVDSREEAIYTDEHIHMRGTMQRVIEKEIAPHVDEWEAAKIFPAHQVIKVLGDNGLLGITKDPEYGGLGLDWSYAAAMAEELGTIRCSGVPMAIGIHTDMATPALNRFGSNRLKSEFLSPSIAGDVVACLGVSEVGSGSDVASIKTTALPKRGSDDLVINGGKMWITSGSQADWMCLLANTSDGPAHLNKSLICLPMKSEGVTISKIISKLGTHSSDTAQIFFDDVVVPRANIIGEEGKGFTYQMMQFQLERLWAVASVLLPMERAITETAEYCQQRKAFGKSILDNQVVHFRLAELETEVEAVRSMLYRAVGLYIQDHDVTKLASMAKLKAGRLFREVADSCLQYWGGMGYTDEVDISRTYLDMRLLSIGAGADEVMLSIICKLSGTLPK